MGWVRARQCSCWALLVPLWGACAQGAAPEPEERSQVAVREGIRVLIEDSLHLVRGHRVGLVTNQTGILSPLEAGEVPTSTVDLLFEHPEVELVALFGPEHGLRGEAAPGERIADGFDERTGLPVHSLYDGTTRPDPSTLAGLDVIVFDIQDIGARYYTYVWTLSQVMEAAGEVGLPVVVLDRPNPIGGEAVQGAPLDPAYASFVGRFAIPMRHGLTPGELARMFVGEFGIEVELHVVPADGWRRAMTFEESGLRWIAPSPNMPSVASALHYPGTCLFEGTGLSVGRGTALPFQQLGAPGLDGVALAAALNERALPGVRFEPVLFTPESPDDGKFGGQEVGGVRLFATDAEVYDPTRSAVATLVEARRLLGDGWLWRPAHFDRLAGSDALRVGIESGQDLEELTSDWSSLAASFETLRRPYLIYP